MILIDKTKTCIIWKNDFMFIIKPKLRKNIKLGKKKVISRNMIDSYYIYPLNEDELNSAFNHYRKYHKIVIHGKEYKNELCVFTEQNVCYVQNKYNLPFLYNYVYYKTKFHNLKD